MSCTIRIIPLLLSSGKMVLNNITHAVVDVPQGACFMKGPWIKDAKQALLFVLGRSWGRELGPHPGSVHAAVHLFHPEGCASPWRRPEQPLAVKGCLLHGQVLLMGMGCPADSSWRTGPREQQGAAGRSLLRRTAPFSGGLSAEHVVRSQGDKPA